MKIIFLYWLILVFLVIWSWLETTSRWESVRLRRLKFNPNCHVVDLMNALVHRNNGTTEQRKASKSVRDRSDSSRSCFTELWLTALAKIVWGPCIVSNHIYVSCSTVGIILMPGSSHAGLLLLHLSKSCACVLSRRSDTVHVANHACSRRRRVGVGG